MTSVHDLTDEELRAELERTRPAYGEYVRDVGEHPDHSSRDLDDGARRHLDVREELDRRAAGHRDVPAARADVPAPGADAPAGAGEAHSPTGPQRDDEDLTDRLDPGEIEPYA
jgi:hypothetical protein